MDTSAKKEAMEMNVKMENTWTFLSDGEHPLMSPTKHD